VTSWLVASGASVTGLDGSQQLLERARVAVPTASFVLGDMRTVNVDGPFDLVVAWDSVFHVPRRDHARIFARFARWLRPGGGLVLSLGGTEWEGTSAMFGEQFFYSGHAPDESLRLLLAAGFLVDHSEIDDPSSHSHLAVLAHRAAS
jgi:cyclopropane fatty-acyl-phospholipid synthase-like methyltransferase